MTRARRAKSPSQRARITARGPRRLKERVIESNQLKRISKHLADVRDATRVKRHSGTWRESPKQPARSIGRLESDEYSTRPPNSPASTSRGRPCPKSPRRKSNEPVYTQENHINREEQLRQIRAEQARKGLAEQGAASGRRGSTACAVS